MFDWWERYHLRHEGYETIAGDPTRKAAVRIAVSRLAHALDRPLRKGRPGRPRTRQIGRPRTLPTAQISAATASAPLLQRRARAGLRRVPARCGRKPRPGHAPLGIGAVLGEGSQERSAVGQRPGGDRPRHAVVQHCLPRTSMSGASQWVVRMAADRARQTALLLGARGRIPAVVRGAVGMLEQGPSIPCVLHDHHHGGLSRAGRHPPSPAGDRRPRPVDRLARSVIAPTLLNGEPVSVRFTATVTCIPGDADQTTTGGAPVFGNFVLPEEPPPTPSTSPAPSHRSRRGDSVVSCHAYSRPGRRPDHVAAPL